MGVGERVLRIVNLRLGARECLLLHRPDDRYAGRKGG